MGRRQQIIGYLSLIDAGPGGIRQLHWILRNRAIYLIRSVIGSLPLETLPIDVLGNRRRLIERRPALLIRHLEEKLKRQLLDIIAVREPIVPQDVAKVRDFFERVDLIDRPYDQGL